MALSGLPCGPAGQPKTTVRAPHAALAQLARTNGRGQHRCRASSASAPGIPSHLAQSPFAFRRAFSIAMSAQTISQSTLSIFPSMSPLSAVSECCSELIGCPIPRSLATSCVCLELRPLPSPGVTRLQRYCEPLRHPTAPSLSLAGVWLVIPDHALGLPVLRALSLCACCRHYPGAAAGRRPRSSHPAVTAFPDNVVGSACTSSFSRLAQRSLALRPAHSRGHLYVTCYTEGFSHFVTSMTAPVASGWSGCRVGLAPTGKRRLVTAHT